MSELLWKIKSFKNLTGDELYEILKIRQEVFVVEQTCYYLDADGYDQDAIHLWLENAGTVSAYARILKPGLKFPEASIGRVLTKDTVCNLGFGKTLLKFAINSIETRFPQSSVRISAQDYLLKFYEAFGFEVAGIGYLEDGIPHTEMIKPL